MKDLPPLDQYKPEYLNADEWAFVMAACARLIPSDGNGPGAIECRVPVYIDRQLAGDFGKGTDWYMVGPYQPAAEPTLGFQSPLPPAEIYRQAIPAFDAWCKTTHGDAFAKLPAEKQDQALTSLQKGEAKLEPELRDFFSFLLANTKEGYFADPSHGGNYKMQAWVWIGFPGARGNFTEWVGRPNAKYPPGPVSLSGERA
ncbi:gluconate 2-dehydrogenase subunit 3 family protein [Aestuariivirga sp.]|uniref:gluconate 2-dehydrogenase subunit 3 family protein n=1 Tax=Aestuariivirga sp. TaxID=2650926 RepID=UPI0039E5ECDE